MPLPPRAAANPTQPTIQVQTQAHNPFGTVSFVLGLLSFVLFCAGPVFSLPALIFGVAARKRVGGVRAPDAAQGTAGLILGAVNVVLFAGTMAGVAAYWPLVQSAIAPVAAPTFLPPVIVPGPPPSPTAPRTNPRANEDGGEMTTIDEVTEVTEGDVRVVDIPSTLHSLSEQLRDQQRKAKAAGETLVLFVTAEDCRPCLSIAAVLPSAKMQTALRRVRLVRVADDVSQELRELGVRTNQVPAFYLLDQNLHPRDGVTGGEWDDDTSDNAAPVLGAFVRGTYTKRRAPFVPLAPLPPLPPTTPRTPSVTLLASAHTTQAYRLARI